MLVRLKDPKKAQFGGRVWKIRVGAAAAAINCARIREILRDIQIMLRLEFWFGKIGFWG